MSVIGPVLRHRTAVLAVSAAVVLAALPGIARLRTDNRPHVFYPEGATALADHAELVERFGSDDSVRLALIGPGAFTEEGLDWLRRVERGAGALQGVCRAGSLYRHHAEALGEWPPDDLEWFDELVSGDTVDIDVGWLSRDRQVVCVLVSLCTDDPATMRALLAELEAVASADVPADARAMVAGLAAVNRALDDSSREIGLRFFPLLVLVAIILLQATLHHVPAVGAALGFVFAAEIVVLGSMGWLGVELNLVLTVLPPLLFVIALATALHLTIACRDHQHRDVERRESIEATWEDKGWAVFWTGVTTAIGFGSLAVSGLPPIRMLGVWAAVSMAVVTLAAFTLYPALLSLVPRPRSDAVARAFESTTRTLGRRGAAWAARHRRLVVAIGFGLAAAGAAGSPLLQIQSNGMHYLAGDEPARSNVELLEAHGVGTATVEVLLDRDDGSFLELDELARLSDLAERLRLAPGAVGVIGAGDVVDDVAWLWAEGDPLDAELSRPDALDELRADDDGRELLAGFVDRDGRGARITVLTKTIGHREMDPLLRVVRATTESALPGVRVRLTGQQPLLIQTQRRLLSTLALSLSITLACVAVVFRVLLPSTRLTLLALVPNLVPVAVVLGFMGWVGVPLDVATVMVASVVLGLAVDDTIHTLGHFRELAPKHGPLGAVAETLEHTASAYVLTAVILAAGFGACALSSFAPTARFGALSALGISTALLGDLLLLPALLAFTPGRAVERLRRQAEP